MTSGLPDRVDCAHLADNETVLERVYPLAELPRLRDLLADAQGSVHAQFAFAKLESGRAMATVAVEARPHLVCQRCLRRFAYPAAGRSELEFVGVADEAAADPGREVYESNDGQVGLRELAEEELLLALPIVAMHAPQSCGETANFEPDERSRPFAGLQDLLKKT
jgi:uncharacterized protein